VISVAPPGASCAQRRASTNGIAVDDGARIERTPSASAWAAIERTWSVIGWGKRTASTSMPRRAAWTAVATTWWLPVAPAVSTGPPRRAAMASRCSSLRTLLPP
jgi:hypothetical protein